MRRNDLVVRRVSPETARRIVNAQKRAKAARGQIRFAKPAENPPAVGVVRPVRARKPKATDYVPEAISYSQTANGRSTEYMRLGTKIRNRRTVVITGAVISRHNDVPVRAVQRSRSAATRGIAETVITVQSAGY